MKKAILLKANYMLYDFNKILEENTKKDKEYKGVLWECKGIHIESGFKVYIYYFNMPDGIDRILLTGIVEQIYPPNTLYDNGKLEQEKCISITDIKGIDTKDTFKFTNKDLCKVFETKLMRSSLYYLDDDNSKQAILLESLEKAKTLKLAELRNYYSRVNCAFDVKNHKDEESYNNLVKLSNELDGFKHYSFLRENNLYYHEGHHFIPKSNIDKIGERINYYENIVSLCPLCHKRIHQGALEDRYKMVKFLYEKNRKFYDNVLLESNLIKEKREALDFIFYLYLNKSEEKVWEEKFGTSTK